MKSRIGSPNAIQETRDKVEAHGARADAGEDELKERHLRHTGSDRQHLVRKRRHTFDKQNPNTPLVEPATELTKAVGLAIEPQDRLTDTVEEEVAKRVTEMRHQ